MPLNIYCLLVSIALKTRLRSGSSEINNKSSIVFLPFTRQNKKVYVGGGIFEGLCKKIKYAVYEHLLKARWYSMLGILVFITAPSLYLPWRY